MKILKPFLGGLFVALTFPACQNAATESASSPSHKESYAPDAAVAESAVADTSFAAPTDRKIIKTADLRGRVKDVMSTTTALENTARQMGGEVMQSALRNDIEDLRQQRISSDSMKEIQSYTTTANLIFKVPVNQLDSFLQQAVGNMQFVNNRNLSLDDVSLTYLSNKLKQQANERDRLKGKNVEEVSYLDDKNENNIDRRIYNMGINERVKFATLSLEIYQPKRADINLVPNVESLIRPSFGEQMRLAMANGWDLVKMLLIGLTNLWAIILLVTIILVLFRNKRLRAKIKGA